MNLESAGGMAACLGDLVVQHSMDAIFLTAPDGRIFSANPAACELFGYTEAEFIKGGRRLVSDASDPEVAALIAEREKFGSVRGEQWMHRKDGRRVRVEVSSAVFETEGEPRTALIVRDMSLQERYRYLQRIAEAATYDLPLIFCVADEDWRLLWVNPSVEQITGYSSDELLDKATPLYCYLEQHNREQLANIEQALRDQGRWSGQIFARRQSGEVYPVQGSITAIDGPDPARRHLVVTMADVSALWDYEHRLNEASFYDPVTGLPNRALFERQVREILDNPSTETEAHYLLIIDIDAFSAINEAHGHKTADQVLEKVAHRLRASLQDRMVVARHTGDSFALLMPDPGGVSEVTLTTLQIKQLLRIPLQVEGVRFALTTSIGISSYPTDGRTPGLLLQSAESALQWAKRHGSDGHAFYEPGSEGASRRFVELAAPMREGLAKSEFLAYFQPIVDSSTHRVVSMETLARWRRADGTIVSPASFIPVAERTGMIDNITETILRQACQHLRRLDAMGYPGLTTAINLSARQFSDLQLPQWLLQVIGDEQVSPDRIVLEITESIFMDNPQEKSALLETLQAEGMQVVIDDFGTGYSSFAYLKHFHVDGIKLDRVFVKDVPGRPKDEALIRMMLAVGNELGIPVVDEGIETQVQATFVREHGCNRMQGYLMAPPLLPSEFATYLNSGAAT